MARLGHFTDLGQAQRDRDVALAGTEVTQAKIDALKNVQLFDAVGKRCPVPING